MNTIAELIDALFKTRLRPDGKEYTYQEIALASQGTIDPSHLSKLRNGKISNPGRDSLLALCRFFKVPPSYFFPELAEPVESDEAENEREVEIALRSTITNLDDISEALKGLMRKLNK